MLLLSIDGMHALDYENCVTAGTCPHLAELGDTGMTYTRTSTAKPSDSFLGLMALVTGGTPKTVGAYYDVASDRVLAPPLPEEGWEGRVDDARAVTGEGGGQGRAADGRLSSHR